LFGGAIGVGIGDGAYEVNIASGKRISRYQKAFFEAGFVKSKDTTTPSNFDPATFEKNLMSSYSFLILNHQQRGQEKHQRNLYKILF